MKADIEGVIYRVTVVSPDYQTFEFNSWTNRNPYDAALALYSSHPSDVARITEQFVQRTEPRTIMSRKPEETGHATPALSSESEDKNNANVRG